MNIALIILAAGRSRRFGADDKLLAPFRGTPLILTTVRHVMAVAISGHDFDIRVVVRPAPSRVAEALEAAGLDLQRQIVTNCRASDGIGTSIAAGIASLPRDTGAAVIIPGDMPFVSEQLIEDVITTFLADGGERPTHPVLADGTQTNPVIWPRAWFPQLMALTGDRGGKPLLTAIKTCTLVLPDPAMAVDIDTPRDLARMQETVGKSHA